MKTFTYHLLNWNNQNWKILVNLSVMSTIYFLFLLFYFLNKNSQIFFLSKIFLYWIRYKIAAILHRQHLTTLVSRCHRFKWVASSYKCCFFFLFKNKNCEKKSFRLIKENEKQEKKNRVFLKPMSFFYVD